MPMYNMVYNSHSESGTKLVSVCVCVPGGRGQRFSSVKDSRCGTNGRGKKSQYHLPVSVSLHFATVPCRAKQTFTFWSVVRWPVWRCSKLWLRVEEIRGEQLEKLLEHKGKQRSKEHKT